AWSPDGTKIAFTRAPGYNMGGSPEVYVMNSDGSAQTDLTNHPAADGQPSWSADGMKIAFTSNRDGDGEIFVMNADGTSPTQLTHDADDESDPAWSPGNSSTISPPTRTVTPTAAQTATPTPTPTSCPDDDMCAPAVGDGIDANVDTVACCYSNGFSDVALEG